MTTPRESRGLLRANIRAPITCQYSGAYYVPIFGAQGTNIRGLGGKTCHCTGCGNIGTWVDYSSLWRGRVWDNRGAEVGLGGGDSPGQSGGHSPQPPATDVCSRKVKNSQARTGHQCGMDGRGTDDDDTPSDTQTEQAHRTHSQLGCHTP